MIVSPSRDKLGDFRPLVAVFFVCFNDGPVLFLTPFVFLDSWIQVIVPSLTTLLSNSSGKSLGNVAPVLCSKLLDVFSKLAVFLTAPRTLDHHRIENLLPPVQALHVSSVREVLCNLLPVLGPVFIDQLSELPVLLFIPVSFVVLRILSSLIHLHDLRFWHV